MEKIILIMFIIIVFAYLLYKQQYSFIDKLKSIFEENGVDEEDCLTWALGDGYGDKPLSETDEIWNERHGDLFIMKGTDNVTAGTLRIIKEYKKHKGIK